MSTSGCNPWLCSALVLFLVAEGFCFSIDNRNRWNMHRQFLHGKSVKKFAIYDLCGREDGRRSFFQKINSNALCGLGGDFIESFMNDLCDQQTNMLFNWAAKLYDLNQNGNIEGFELQTIYDRPMRLYP